MTEDITSTQNPRIKALLALKQKRQRDADGVFLIEGEKEIMLAAEHGFEIKTLFYCPPVLSKNTQLLSPEQLTAIAADCVAVSDRVFARIAYRDRVGGLVALATIPAHHRQLDTQPLAEVLNTQNPFLLVVEALEKPGNLGALLRTADAAGVDAVICCDPRGDLYNPNVVRNSLGAIFTLPILLMSSGLARRQLRDNGIVPIPAVTQAGQPYTRTDLTGPLAIILGAEHPGLQDRWLQGDTRPVTIPMNGAMDSLNVSCSGAILLFEARRQRDRSAR